MNSSFCFQQKFVIHISFDIRGLFLFSSSSLFLPSAVHLWSMQEREGGSTEIFNCSCCPSKSPHSSKQKKQTKNDTNQHAARVRRCAGDSSPLRAPSRTRTQTHSRALSNPPRLCGSYRHHGIPPPPRVLRRLLLRGGAPAARAGRPLLPPAPGRVRNSSSSSRPPGCRRAVVHERRRRRRRRLPGARENALVRVAFAFILLRAIRSA
jgi:hypothetical protein